MEFLVSLAKINEMVSENHIKTTLKKPSKEELFWESSKILEEEINDLLKRNVDE